jgi:sugar lactone lactonase YvrE
MRTRILLAMVLLLAVATPVHADEHNEPLDVDQAIEIGRAAETNGLNGLYVSPFDGNVYVASVGGDEITVHDPDTGELLDRLGPESGVRGPDDVFIADDGTVYWTEILTGFVGMLKPDGTFMRQEVGPGVNPITMSDDGRLFVGRIFLGMGLYELDPDLDPGVPPVLLNADLVVNGFDFGPDGNLYAPSFFTGEVLKIDVDAAMPVGEVVADGFQVLSSVKFDSMGNAHTVDLAAGQVFKLDLVGGNHEMLIDIEGTIDNMAFDADDRLFIAAGNDNQIIRRDADGITALGEPGLGLPGGVAASPDGSVWVGDFFAMRGFESNPKEWTTSFYDRFAPPGTGFASAATVAADGDNLIISSGFSNSVQIIDPATGAIVLDIRTLAGPTNAIRHGDALVASQLLAGNVVNAETAEVLADSLAVPLGLASDGETLYVGDWATGIVWAVADTGTTMLATGLAFPEGMAVDGDRLLVVETGLKQVTAIDLATGDTSAAIVGLDYSDRIPEAFFPYGLMSGVEVGPDRSIYVSDDGVNKVYEFRRRGTTTQHTDTAGNIFAEDIVWVGQAGITFGCNPPVNDNYCPTDLLNRGQLAAMFVRALDLPASATDYFTDDDTSIFENDINALAQAGITFGCNPPTGDNYCPLDTVNRGQVAAMFARALDLPASATDYFTDDDTSIFENDINALAQAGITLGCNPPANDNYCAEDTFTRGQMAAFWRRALS